MRRFAILFVGATVAAAIYGCAAGEDNSNVQVVAVTNTNLPAPGCTPDPSANGDVVEPSETTNSGQAGTHEGTAPPAPEAPKGCPDGGAADGGQSR